METAATKIETSNFSHQLISCFNLEIVARIVFVSANLFEVKKIDEKINLQFNDFTFSFAWTSLCLRKMLNFFCPFQISSMEQKENFLYIGRQLELLFISLQMNP